jgi:hypothetical protein
MNIWKRENTKNINIGIDKLRKLHKVAENNTRWWSRHKALEWIFKGENCLFPTFKSVLFYISTDYSFNNNTTSEANSLLKNMCEFKNILTTHIFLEIFKYVRPTSDYLQIKQLDFISTCRMVENTIKDIKQSAFKNIIKRTKQFAVDINDNLFNLEIPENVFVKDKFQESRRVKKKRKQFDENTEDESFTQPIDKFRVQTFQQIFDQLNMSFKERFSANKELIADAQLFEWLFKRKFSKKWITKIGKFY